MSKKLSLIERQEIYVAKMRRLEIEKKVQSQKVQSSGALNSQWDRLMGVNRMIRCNHMMKSNHQLELDYVKSKIKKEQTGTKIVLVRKV